MTDAIRFPIVPHWRLFHVLILPLAVLLSTVPADARTYALLVGVSSYPALEDRFQLKGPDNDAELMHEVLLKRGIAKADIQVLRSGGAVKPTKANIVTALQQLAKKVGPDDFVYLHFAGHGSQQPARPGDSEEGDGLDEIFLPQDVGHWNDEVGEVENAISDNEFNQLITAIRARGSFVWSVFDSCHSGTMLRGINSIKWRYVDPTSLAIPRPERNPGSTGGLPHFGAAPPLQESETAAPGGFVAFYAAQTNELAPELAMPPDGDLKQTHGLFTYSLAEAMTTTPDISYRHLGQLILQKYVRLGMRATTPLIEGTAQEAVLFGSKPQPAVQQWPVSVRGARAKRLYVPAGELNQIGKGALFAIMDSAADSDDKAIGYAQADYVELFGAQIQPVAHAGKPMLDIAAIPGGAYARLVNPAFQFSLTVAKPKAADAKTAREQRLLKVIDAVSGETAPAAGLQLKWVASGAPADVHLLFTPSGENASETAGCERDRLWFLDRTGGLVCNGARANMSFEIGEPSAAFDANVRTALLDTLNAIGKVRNLEQMVERFQSGKFGDEVAVKVFVTKQGSNAERELDQSTREPLTAGDMIRLDVANDSDFPVDTTVLFVDSRYGVAALFPTQGRTNRIESGQRITDIRGEITEDTLGLEGMIVIAAKANTGAPVADFSFLAQKQLRQQRIVRSIGGGEPSTANPDDQFIDDLFASAGFGGTHSTKTRSVGADDTIRTPFKRVTAKSLRWMVGNN